MPSPPDRQCEAEYLLKPYKAGATGDEMSGIGTMIGDTGLDVLQEKLRAGRVASDVCQEIALIRSHSCSTRDLEW